MFRDAMLMDLKPHEFWNMTIREFYIYSECFHEKQKEQMDYDMSLAWYNAYFQRVDRMPKLHDVVKPKLKPQSELEMFKGLKQFSSKVRGEVK